jgi:hypothetical protein
MHNHRKTQSRLANMPISHIVCQAPNFVGYQDACTLWGMGGHSPNLQYYWRTSWQDMHKDLPDKIKYTINKRGSDNIHINWLEFATIVINYAGVIITARHDNLVPPFPPMIQLHRDDKTGNKVVSKGTLKSDSEIAGAVSQILSNLQRQMVYGLTCPHIEGKTNDFTDDLSRKEEGVWLPKVRSYNTAQLNFYLHPQENAPLILTVCYRRYRPSQELLSVITTTIFEPRRITVSLPLRLSMLGHLLLDINITTNLGRALRSKAVPGTQARSRNQSSSADIFCQTVCPSIRH